MSDGRDPASSAPDWPRSPPSSYGGDRATGEHEVDTSTPDDRTAPDSSDGPVTARGISRHLLALAEEVSAVRSRVAAERQTCEGLVEAGPYHSAWIGVRAPDGDGLVVRAPAGGESDWVGRPDERETTGEGPWTAAIRTREITAVDAADLDPVTVPTGGADGGSVAAVPLGRDAPVDGVLVVATERQNAFGELERTGLAALGTTLRLTVDAIRSREVFFADGVVSLELRLTDPDSLLVKVSKTEVCRLSLEGYAAKGDRWRLQYDVEGADPRTIAGVLAEEPGVEHARVVIDRTDGGRLELEVADSPLLCRTAGAGATVETAVADHGSCRVTLELPDSGDVCETLARLRATFPGIEFLSLRRLDRGPTEPTVPAGLLDELTDRQREVLEVAYDAGYFEWPRAKTAEEIAPELGITSPTLHWHLREAERRLLAALLD